MAMEQFRCAEPVFGSSLGENFSKLEIRDMEMAMEQFRCAEPVFGSSLGENFPKLEIRDTEMAIRINQAHLANSIKNRPARRLRGGQSSTADRVDRKSRTGSVSFPYCIWTPKKLQMHEEPLKLTDVTMFLPRGESSLCTFEAHVNGLRITGDLKFHVDLMFSNVSESLLRLQGERSLQPPPVLLFRLHDPIMVLGEETKDIQVCLYPRPYKDSAKTEKDERTRCRNEELVNFARKVEENHRTRRTEFPMRFHALEEYEFDGVNPVLGPATYALTKSALVVIQNEPRLLVISLRDIEIVNLTHLEPDMICMTIVFEDFDRGVFQILSIPSRFLTDIKHRLNFGEVKFYVNESRVRWDILVRDIAKFPQMFRDRDGWDSLYLEDDLTLAYYPRVYSNSGFQRGSMIC